MTSPSDDFNIENLAEEENKEVTPNPIKIRLDYKEYPGIDLFTCKEL